MSISPLILVVDDAAANRDTLIVLLEAEKYRSVEAADGPTALRLAAEEPPDLVLLDVMMPGMDGFEVCRRLRADARLAEVPVIMITALDDQASRLAGLEAGADDFATKPINRAELRARVRTITRLNRYRRLVEAQTALRESESRFELLAEHSDEVFWFVSLHDQERNTYVSPAVEKIWGVPAARFCDDARLWWKAIHPDDQPQVLAAYDALVAGETNRFTAEYRVIRADGGIRWVLDSGTLMRKGDLTPVSIGGVARDITERKESEDRLLRAQRLENLGMLAAGIAHDFNNALAPLVMGCSVVRSYVSDPGGQGMLDTMERSAGRSVALVKQLLSFARGTTGQDQLLQVRHVLKDVIDLAEATFPKSIRVDSHLSGDLWPVQASATQLHQVFLNLCINARDALPQGGELTLTAENRRLDAAAAAEIADARPGSFLAVEVRDTGTGIPPDVLARIWEPFYTTKGEGKGTGLGLSTVRGILQNHDGFVTVVTHLGRGTTFTVFLPAAESGVGGGQADSPVAKAARGQGELLLVVDDEEPVRELAARILTDHGYQVLTACDGADAIAVFAPRAAYVRLLLTDLQMPILGGIALAGAVRRMQPRLPIVVMSGIEIPSSAPLKDFAAAFLAKPFQVETLLSMVRRMLDTAVPAAVT